MQRATPCTALLILAFSGAVSVQALASHPAHTFLPSAKSPAAPSAKVSPRDLRLAKAEALLRQGQPLKALGAFEQAANTEHAVDIELGILHSHMQAGQYQQALNFAAHTAGAHLDESDGAAFYAWLLHLGGQHDIALKTLEKAQQRMPGDAALARVAELIQGNAKMEAVLQKSQQPFPASERLMPYAYGAAVPANAQVKGTAILLKGGRLAIAPAESVGKTDRLWVRNGLGRTVRASVKQTDTGAGLALLALDKALDEPDTRLAAAEAFAGSPAYAFGYQPGNGQEAAWPKTSVGFLGKVFDTSNNRLLGFEVPSEAAGTPVVDLKGRLVGIVLAPLSEGKPRLGALSAIRQLAPSTAAAFGDNANLPLADLYEQAMRMALQVIVLD